MKLSLAAALILALPAQAQIRTDASLGLPAQSLAGPHYLIAQSLGKLSGPNLFQSFQTFKLASGETATFSTSTAGIANVISRVTGGEASLINGQISLLPFEGKPAFFFINPAGVLFGEGAAIDVPGAFHVSTANYLQFADGGRLHADLGQASSFSSAAPEAFGFLGTSRAPLSLRDGAVIAPNALQASSLVGGDVSVDSALLVGSGAIRVAAVGAQAAQVPVAADRAAPALSGLLSISNGGLIGSSNLGSADAGPIRIDAGDITLSGESSISSFTQAGSSGQGAPITLRASGSLSMEGFSNLYAKAAAAGRAGDISVAARDILLGSGAYIEGGTAAGSSGSGGDIVLRAGRSLSLADGASMISSTEGSGQGGAVDIGAASARLSGDAYIANAAFAGSGDAGDIRLHTSGDLLLDSGGELLAYTTAVGRSGQIKVSAANISLGFGSSISNAAVGPAARAGGIALTASGALSLREGASLSTVGLSGGHAGSIAVTARQATLEGGSFISSGSLDANGSGGNVQISASGAISLGRDSYISANTFTDADAGTITLQGQDISLDGAQLSSTAFDGRGNAGSIELLASRRVDIAGGSSIGSATLTPGQAGQIRVTAADFKLSGPGLIYTSSGAALAGHAGNVAIQTSGSLSITNSGQIDSSSLSLSGHAGDISLKAGTELLLERAALASRSALSEGSGRAGTISLQAGTRLSLSQETTVSTNTLSGGQAGQISLAAADISLDLADLVSQAGFGSRGGGRQHRAAGHAKPAREQRLAGHHQLWRRTRRRRAPERQRDQLRGPSQRRGGCRRRGLGRPDRQYRAGGRPQPAHERRCHPVDQERCQRRRPGAAAAHHPAGQRAAHRTAGGADHGRLHRQCGGQSHRGGGHRVDEPGGQQHQHQRESGQRRRPEPAGGRAALAGEHRSHDLGVWCFTRRAGQWGRHQHRRRRAVDEDGLHPGQHGRHRRQRWPGADRRGGPAGQRQQPVCRRPDAADLPVRRLRLQRHPGGGADRRQRRHRHHQPCARPVGQPGAAERAHARSRRARPQPLPDQRRQLAGQRRAWRPGPLGPGAALGRSGRGGSAGLGRGRRATGRGARADGVRPMRWLPLALAVIGCLAALPALGQQQFQLPPLPVEPARAGQLAAIRVDQVSFRGNTVLSDAELQAVAAPYIGRRVGADELETLRQALTRAYTDRGYVNSGLLLPAEPRDGLLQFEVIEGRLTGLRLRGMDGLNEAYLLARLRRDDEPVLNMERLRERFQLLLDDPLFERINARLEPGAAAGEAILDLEVQRARPWQLSAFVNNYRPASIGAGSAGLAGSLRNLSGQGDLLELKLQGPIRQGHGGQGSLGWQMPLAALGLPDSQLSLALESGSSSVIEEPVRLLDIRSRLRSRDIGFSHRLHESLGQSVSIGVNRLSRDNRTELLGEPFSFTPGVPDGETTETLWRFWQAYAWRSDKQVLALRSSFSWGSNNVQAIAGLPPEATPDRRFRLWSGQLHYGRQLGEGGAQLIARLTVQHTPDRLLALDGLTLGGISSVRGFRENQLVRDRGAYLNLEFEYPWIKGAELRWTLSPFFDYGRVSRQGEAATTLASWGLASRWLWKGWQLDLVLADRLRQPDALRDAGDSLQDQGVHLQLAWKF